jgi:hypothetical protein
MAVVSVYRTDHPFAFSATESLVGQEDVLGEIGIQNKEGWREQIKSADGKEQAVMSYCRL